MEMDILIIVLLYLSSWHIIQKSDENVIMHTSTPTTLYNYYIFNSEYCISAVLIGSLNSSYQLLLWVTSYGRKHRYKEREREWKEGIALIKAPVIAVPLLQYHIDSFHSL